MIWLLPEPDPLQRSRRSMATRPAANGEQLFAVLAAALKAKGFTRFIVPEGKTSSIVAQTWGG